MVHGPLCAVPPSGGAKRNAALSGSPFLALALMIGSVNALLRCESPAQPLPGALRYRGAKVYRVSRPPRRRKSPAIGKGRSFEVCGTVRPVVQIARCTRLILGHRCGPV